ncbi:hypothetical protein SAMN05216184_101669 [Georgenia satyanarayanai]|uniref:MJ0042 family finger-like domain-containing protein n=1 Tax=Georgenia satyanarayanai TaxID=860221 RepID=A0A2Y9BVB0_9MICO|nr:DUF6510 family protein [Georgenia satyanarayanai]PYG02198.1 hypothetical protein A8987_101669 [Georgenia satyanarayanai]SSA37032.1 hypothetical protein SAMN05216184_101669 [Georgenia satyanarayanai]
MNHLDGNALAGVFADTLGVEITTAIGQCGSCRRSFELARARASVTAMGAVMRCAGCDSTLAVIVDNGHERLVNLSGLAYIRVARP